MSDRANTSKPNPEAKQETYPIGEECYPFLLDAAESEIENQADAFNQLDNKTGVILGFSLVAIVQMFGFTMKSSNPFVDLPLAVSLAAVSAALSLLAATLVGVSARWPRDFDNGWTVTDLITKEEPTLARLHDRGMTTLRKAIAANDKVLKKKATLSNAAHFFVLLALVLFSSAFLMMAVDGIWNIKALPKGSTGIVIYN